MGWELNTRQPLAGEIKRIMTELLDQALSLVHAKYESEPTVAVHNLRKLLRRMRAILRLVRPALGKEGWGKENGALRDLGRQLATARDGVVLHQTLERVAGDDLETVASLRKMLVAPASVELPELAEVSEVLEQVRGRVEGWPLSGDRWRLIGEGLEATYRAGQQAVERARKNRSTENLHEWRKRAKELRHQVEMLVPLKPVPLGRLSGELHQLCDLLGEDHDLGLLAEALGPGGAPLGERIERRRQEAQKEARRLGRELYAAAPGKFVGRVRGWWKGR